MKKLPLMLLSLALCLSICACTESTLPDDTDGRVNAPNTDPPPVSGTTAADTADQNPPIDTKPADTKPAVTEPDTKPEVTPSTGDVDIMDLEFDTAAEMVAGLTDHDKVSTANGMVFYELSGLPSGFTEAGCVYDASEAEYTISYKNGDQMISVTPMIEEKLKAKFESYAITKEFGFGSRSFKCCEGTDTDGKSVLQVFVFDKNESYFLTITGLEADEGMLSKTELDEIKPKS